MILLYSCRTQQHDHARSAMRCCASEATNAEKAAESAHVQVSTMIPGSPGYVELMQLALPHGLATNKESKFVEQVVSLGEALPIPIQRLHLDQLQRERICIQIRALAEYILKHYPAKLLAGYSSVADAGFQAVLIQFWDAFRVYNPIHPVFSQFDEQLHLCIPVKMHCDEGTGLRRSAVNQFSWGPVLSSSPHSLDRYFFWSCMNGKDYKEGHAGYELGNVILDELCSSLASQASSVYSDGVACPEGGRAHLVWVALEGDLPAQARACHVKRNFNCMPNGLCPWCHADDLTIPFSDLRPCATWRSTVGASRPWTAPGPFSQIPGGDHELFLAKDLFHLCHLGAVRGFAINFLCYLTMQGHFAPCMQENSMISGRSSNK